MIISEEHFFDYIDCPTKYELKHINKVEITENKSVPKLLSSVVNYFFFSVYNGKIPSMEALKNRWDKICEKNIDYIDPKKNLEGIGLIVKLYNYAKDKRLVVLSHGNTYSIDTDNKNKLVGSLSNPIVSLENGGMEMLVPYLGSKIPKSVELDTKLKFTIDSIGFERLNNERLDGINILLVNKMREYNTTRNHLDEKRLHYAIDGVCNGIENKVFYPRESVFCNYCSARSLCRFWNGNK